MGLDLEVTNTRNNFGLDDSAADRGVLSMIVVGVKEGVTELPALEFIAVGGIFQELRDAPRDILEIYERVLVDIQEPVENGISRVDNDFIIVKTVDWSQAWFQLPSEELVEGIPAPLRFEIVLYRIGLTVSERLKRLLGEGSPGIMELADVLGVID